VAGRCISVDHHADVYTRNQGSCMATGEAAGVAAAVSVADRVSPRAVDVSKIQRGLQRLGVDLELLRKLGPSPERLD
jgi:FAD dependent oxidoreductase